MTEQTQTKHQENPISIQARIWRAVDKMAAGQPSQSPEREAEYAARQALRAAVDLASKGNR